MTLIIFILTALAGGVIFALFVKYFYRPARDKIRSVFVVKELLKETKPTRSAMKGEHLADRLLDLWNNGDEKPLLSRDVVYGRGGFWEGVWLESVMDKKLSEKGLVKIYEEKGSFYVKLSKTNLTRFVIEKLAKLEKEKIL